MKKKLWAILAVSLVGVLVIAGIIVFIVLPKHKNDIKPDNPTHTHEYTETVEPPTCTTDGYILHKCECGEEYKDNETPALGHDYQAETTAPTCTVQGYTTYTCTRCGNSYVDDYTDKIPHDYEWTTTKEPTETEDGVKTGVCKNCGDTTIKIIPSLNHVHTYVDTVIEPTCTTGGYTLHRCYCEDEYITDEIPALGHTPANAEMENEVPPACTDYGSYEIVIYCTVCGEEISRETVIVPPVGHGYVITESEPATCTENGYIKYVCNYCEDEKIQIIPAEGHYFGDDNVCDKCGYELSIIHEHEYAAHVVAPTCTTMGYTDYTCDCGASFRADYIEPLGHRYDNGVVIKDKTCTENGLIKYTCIRCETSYTEPIPAGHTWSETITEPATCTTDGKVYKVCVVCGEEQTEILPAHHTWDNGVIIEDATCTESGEIRYTCTVCGATEIREIPPKGHRYVNGVCIRCGEKFIDNVSEYPDHPVYGFYFLLDEIRSDYGPRLINEYGALLYVNEGAELDKVAVYITQDDILWRRCIACTGSNIEFAIFVPYLSYGNEIIYTGLNSSSINTFTLSKGSDGIWRYSEYATIGANLADYQGNLLLDLYDIGQAGAKTRVFDDLGKMKAWLKGENPDTVHIHTVVIDEGIAATCTQNGLTAGSHCSVCGEVLVARELIPAGHTPAQAVQENYVGAHCIHSGSYDSVVYCSVCGVELSRETIVIPEIGHVPDGVAELNYVAATCIHSGGYDSVVYCVVCGEELSRETVVIPATGVHNYENGVCSVCGAQEPVNPPIEPQGDLYVIDGDYIYFGTYPQSDVTETKGNELSAYVQTKPTNGNNNGWTSYNYYIYGSNTTDFMWYKDVDVDNNGTKDYRAVYFTRYRPYFTSYSSSTADTYQDDNGYTTSNVYWFKYEPIKWRILSQEDNTAIILAELILDSQDYNYTISSRTIENKTVYSNNYAYSSIRAWLNDNFYNTAFNEYEKALINTIEVDNSARSTNPDNDATYYNNGINDYACENTYDKVWLLSNKEVTTAEYGFDEDSYAYGVDSTRIRKTSAYAQCQGAYTHSSESYDGNGNWWLRSPYYDDEYISWRVDLIGYSDDHYYVYNAYIGVVPALQISLAPDPQPTPDEYFTFTLLNDDTYEIKAKDVNKLPVKVVLPSIYNNKAVTRIGANAFASCTRLTSITIPNSIIRVGDWAFSWCSRLTHINVDENNPNYKSIDGNLYSKDGETLIQYAPGKTDTALIPNGTIIIKYYAFHSCSNLTSITIPDSVTSIGFEALCCTSLTNISVDDNNSNYKSIDGNLYSKDGKTLIQYPQGKTETEFAIPYGVTSIGGNAFDGCSKLTSVIVPNSVISIGSEAFRYCSLTEITIPNGVTIIHSFAFSDCSSLTSVTFGENSQLTSIERYAFHSCRSLTSITIPDSVTSIGDSAFEYCSSLTSIMIPDSVTSIGDYAFRECSSLTSINVDGNNGNYKSIDGNLYSKDGTTLIQYAIGKIETQFIIPDNVTSIGDGAFRGCIWLINITIHGSITRIGDGAFCYCSSLYYVINKSNLQLTFGSSDNGYITAYAKAIEDKNGNITFNNDTTYIQNDFLFECVSGKYYLIAYIGKEEIVTLPLMYDGDEYSIHGMRGVKNLIIPQGFKSIGDYAFDGCITLKSIIIPNSLTSIGDCAFRECSSLSEIIIPDSVTSIGSGAFSGCSSLTNITIPSSVTSIRGVAFYNCQSLTSINVDGNNGNYKSIDGNLYSKDGTTLIQYAIGKIETQFIIPDNVTNIGWYAFAYCSSLTSITIPDSVTSIDDGAFYNCSSLTSITIPDGVTRIASDAFSSCSSLTSITIPDSVTRIGDDAFYRCSNLTSIQIPDEVTNIGIRAFWSCRSLTSITIPNSVTSIGRGAFYDCSSLTSIIIPDSVTSIGNFAFENCSSLTSITIPDSVTSIGSEAFDCSSLIDITFSGTIEQWNSISKDNYWNNNVPATVVHCTDGDVAI